MREFIVWDKINDCFFEPTCEAYKNDLHYLVVNQKGELLSVSINKHNNITLTHESLFSNNFTIHQFIGKKDINNKKVYADCSIFEFEFITIAKTIRKAIGYATYNKDNCFYQIKILNDLVDSTSFLGVTDFKIIDTIQENKLGLINE